MYTSDAHTHTHTHTHTMARSNLLFQGEDVHQRRTFPVCTSWHVCQSGSHPIYTDRQRDRHTDSGPFLFLTHSLSLRLSRDVLRLCDTVEPGSNGGNRHGYQAQPVPPLRRIQGRREERPRADGPRVDGRVLGRQQLAVGLGAVHPSPQLHLAATPREDQRLVLAKMDRSKVNYPVSRRRIGHVTTWPVDHVERENRRGL